MVRDIMALHGTHTHTTSFIGSGSHRTVTRAASHASFPHTLTHSSLPLPHTSYTATANNVNAGANDYGTLGRTAIGGHPSTEPAPHALPPTCGFPCPTITATTVDTSLTSLTATTATRTAPRTATRAMTALLSLRVRPGQYGRRGRRSQGRSIHRRHHCHASAARRRYTCSRGSRFREGSRPRASWG